MERPKQAADRPTCDPLRTPNEHAFCLQGSVMVLLHGFTKKSQKTPSQDIALARKRLKEEWEP